MELDIQNFYCLNSHICVLNFFNFSPRFHFSIFQVYLIFLHEFIFSNINDKLLKGCVSAWSACMTLATPRGPPRGTLLTAPKPTQHHRGYFGWYPRVNCPLSTFHGPTCHLGPRPTFPKQSNYNEGYYFFHGPNDSYFFMNHFTPPSPRN